MFNKYFLSSLFSGIAFFACCQNTKVTFKAPVFYPEGVAYDAGSKTFFVGSVKTGTIAKVDAAGKFTEFYSDSTLMSSFGMKLMKGMLWVCTGDPNYSIYTTPETRRKKIRLIGLDLRTGEKTSDIDISNLFNGDHFANDLDMDAAGNIFITDSYSPVIYKVDPAGKATVFAENKLFKGSDIGLNGIAFFTDGFLLVVNNSDGSLLKVDIKNPSMVQKVKVDQFFPGADGLVKMTEGKLVLIQNKGVDNAFVLTSSDGWKTAKVVAATSPLDYLQNPSTGVLVNGNVYVVNAKLNEITDLTKKPSLEFTLQQIMPKTVSH